MSQGVVHDPLAAHESVELAALADQPLLVPPGRIKQQTGGSFTGDGEVRSQRPGAVAGDGAGEGEPLAPRALRGESPRRR